MTHLVPTAYRLPLWVGIDPLFKRSLVASGVLGLLVLVVVVVVPAVDRTLEMEVAEVPERFARLILEPPARPAPVVETPSAAPTASPAPEASAADPAPDPRPARPQTVTPVHEPSAPVTVDVGRAGKERATVEVASSLAQATQALDKTLASLSTSLASRPEAPRSAVITRKGGVPQARRGSEVAAVAASSAGSGVTADLGGSVAAGALIRLDGLGSSGGGSAGSAGSPGGRRRGGSAGAAGRSDASLLAVVERYAAGIRFCYDNELKKDSTLRGKLVISITVAASGEVTEARVAEDTVGSAALSACVLAKIESWTFPQIPAGSTIFQAPFVFTPPRE